MGDLALVRACEERIVNCWPAIDTLLIEGFVVRFAYGYSGRANAATPMEMGADLTDGALDQIESLYRQAGLAPIIRITPLAAPDFEARLLTRGYVLRDESCGLIAPLPAAFAQNDVRIRIETHPGQEWLAGVSMLQDASKSNPAHLAAIVGRIRVPAAFATLYVEQRPVGFGMSAIDRGMAEIGSIILSPHCRGQGLGKALVAGLLHFAASSGAHHAFLQVESKNNVAKRLYEGFGFAPLYTYRTMILRD